MILKLGPFVLLVCLLSFIVLLFTGTAFRLERTPSPAMFITSRNTTTPRGMLPTRKMVLRYVFFYIWCPHSDFCELTPNYFACYAHEFLEALGSVLIFIFAIGLLIWNNIFKNGRWTRFTQNMFGDLGAVSPAAVQGPSPRPRARYGRRQDEEFVNFEEIPQLYTTAVAVAREASEAGPLLSRRRQPGSSRSASRPGPSSSTAQ